MPNSSSCLSRRDFFPSVFFSAMNQWAMIYDWGKTKKMALDFQHRASHSYTSMGFSCMFGLHFWSSLSLSFNTPNFRIYSWPLNNVGLQSNATWFICGSHFSSFDYWELFQLVLVSFWHTPFSVLRFVFEPKFWHYRMLQIQPAYFLTDPKNQRLLQSSLENGIRNQYLSVRCACCYCLPFFLAFLS